MKRPKVQIYKHHKDAASEARDEWGWRLLAANGEEIASGEGHDSPRDAERAFRMVCAVTLEVVADSYQSGAGFARVEVIEDPEPAPEDELEPEPDPDWPHGGPH
jgi:uncharacterized protein YegP (UPF0339 family)